MPRLAQLLATHGSILVLDAASQRVQIGVLRAGQAAVWAQSTDEAGRGVFSGTDSVLRQTGLSLGQIGAFVYAEGPGSMLGVRTVAMALRTWGVLQARPVYRYQSLAVAGLAEWRRSARAFTIIADARRDTWHAQGFAADGTMTTLQRRAAGDLPAGEWLTPEHFRAWAQPPRAAAVCSYDLSSIFSAATEADLFHPTAAPDAFQHEAPEYKKWSAQTHSVETAPRK